MIQILMTQRLDDNEMMFMPRKTVVGAWLLISSF
jgi:hypothetical protein